MWKHLVTFRHGHLYKITGCIFKVEATKMWMFKILIELVKGSTSSAFWLWTVWYTVLWKQKPVQILEVEKLALSWATPANKTCFSPPVMYVEECGLPVATLLHSVWVHPLHGTGWIRKEGAGSVTPRWQHKVSSARAGTHSLPQENPVFTTLISLKPNPHFDITF